MSVSLVRTDDGFETRCEATCQREQQARRMRDETMKAGLPKTLGDN